MKKQRKQYAPEEKVAILRRHLLEKEPISKLCDEVGLQPTVFYRWQKEFFENGAAAFEQKRPTNHSADQERIAYLEKKIHLMYPTAESPAIGGTRPQFSDIDRATSKIDHQFTNNNHRLSQLPDLCLDRRSARR